MNELWDIYDINKNKTGRIAERNAYNFQKGEYHIVVTGIIMNSKNEILISKRAKNKKFGGMWECNGGSILSGETSLEGILRELKEELGIKFTKKEAIFLKEIRRDKIPPDFKELWLFRKDIKIEDITFPDGEAIEAKWVNIEEFMNMCNSKKIIPTIDFGKEEYIKALNIKQRKSYSYIVTCLNGLDIWPSIKHTDPGHEGKSKILSALYFSISSEIYWANTIE